MIGNFNNLLAILLAVLIMPSLWVLQGIGIINLPGEILGVTIMSETLIIQFYFRRKAPDNPAGKKKQ